MSNYLNCSNNKETISNSVQYITRTTPLVCMGSSKYFTKYYNLTETSFNNYANNLHHHINNK